MSVWDDFGKLELLWINILNYDNDGYNNHKYATIFGNGKNQATIYIRISDKNKKILIIPDDELLKAVHLVHYTEGKRLNRQGDNSNYKPWVYTNEDLGYAKVISTSNTVKSEVSTYGEYGQVIKLYLHATEPNEGFKISAGIDIPGVGNFNTSEMGTITRNGPEGKTGSAFKYPHFVHIKAITPIDYGSKYYGSKYNVLVNKGSSEISNKIKISKVGNERQDLKDIFYFNGISKREDISIRPKEIKSNDKNTFKVINVIRDKKANLDTVKFLNNNLPDIIVGMGGGSFSSYFVFVAPQDLVGLMTGSCIYGVEEFTNIVYKYELSQKVTNYGGSDSPNLSSSSPSAAVFILQCNIPLRNVGKFNWCNQNENAVVKMEVIDSYGNSGIITIKSHYGDSSIIDITINEE